MTLTEKKHNLFSKQRLLLFFSLKTLGRRMLDKQISPIISKYCNGNVLEIGALNSPYKRYMNFKSYSVLDINNEDADYNMDIHKNKIKSSSFDTVIATQVLEHLYNPFLAIKEVFRILKTGGYFIGSTVFLYPYHGEPRDYFRFTEFGLKKIFEDFNIVKMIKLGNPTAVVIDLLTVEYKFLKPIRLLTPMLKKETKKNTKIPIGFIIVAQK